MVFSLLSTKYHIPSTGIQCVARDHLLQKLNGGLRQGVRVILVCAPAGYGKTTLVSEWANQLAPGPMLVEARPAWRG